MPSRQAISMAQKVIPSRTQVKTLELNNENAQLSYSIQKLTLEKTVTQLFYNVYMAQMSLTIMEEQNQNTQKSYDIIKNKVDAGLAAKEQLFQAEVNLETGNSFRKIRAGNIINFKNWGSFIWIRIMPALTLCYKEVT